MFRFEKIVDKFEEKKYNTQLTDKNKNEKK